MTNFTICFILLSASGLALMLENDITCSVTLKTWLWVMVISGTLHFTCRVIEKLLEPLQGARAMFRGIRETNVALLILWFSLGNLWIIENGRCQYVTPQIYITSLICIIVADLRAFLPLIGRLAVVFCPMQALCCLRYAFGVVGVVIDTSALPEDEFSSSLGGFAEFFSTASTDDPSPPSGNFMYLY